MQAILKKLNDLLSTAEIRIKKCDEERNQYLSKKSALDNQEKDLAGRVEAVTIREKNVTVYEDLGTAQNEIALDRKQVKAEADRLKQKEMDLDAKIAAHDKKIKDDGAEIDRQKEKLAKQSIEIDKKAASYKKEVMDAISKASK